MTQEQFNNYKFSVNTKVKLFNNDIWNNVTGVDFYRCEIELNGCRIIPLEAIKEITNQP